MAEITSNSSRNNKSIVEVSSEGITDGENTADNREAEKSISDQSVSFRQQQENMDRVARVKIQDLKRQI